MAKIALTPKLRSRNQFWQACYDINCQHGSGISWIVATAGNAHDEIASLRKEIATLKRRLTRLEKLIKTERP